MRIVGKAEEDLEEEGEGDLEEVEEHIIAEVKNIMKKAEEIMMEVIS